MWPQHPMYLSACKDTIVTLGGKCWTVLASFQDKSIWFHFSGEVILDLSLLKNSNFYNYCDGKEHKK